MTALNAHTARDAGPPAGTGGPGSGSPARPTGAGLAARRTRARVRAVLAALVTLVFVAPIYLMLVNAFKGQDRIVANPASLPIPPILDNLGTALTRPDNLIPLGLRNSLIVVVCSVALLIPLGAAFSFHISRRRTRTRAAILVALAAGLMVPPQVTLLPTIQILTWLGLDHSYPGLILSNLGGGYLSFAVFVYVGFMRGIPDEIIQAARIDGASGLRIWWQIVMPLVRPASATVAIFLSLWIWNDFLNPLFILGPLQGQTITTGLYLTIGQYSVDYGQLFGIMFLAGVLPVLGYLAAQKQFVAGLTAGSTK
ncbi:carbohydrate ABC transporter permease [Plantactinospora soyae]|uniref:Multiple sugar transport system permease protein/raffinose/stachyose/melibiose transport system permease protein n=1 Tax=Plantactinospora soyae TaxID=1544732 RepID=A0A927MEY1_9ACTN|nr:carbohydrate ABC transporter permease [Plantactinospora soyae]MBE1491831.1 multiple sugar transport system permease protein/raffinose/stachyose/melibiose transport system permease protein [Plantactinospora soyae]